MSWKNTYLINERPTDRHVLRGGPYEIPFRLLKRIEGLIDVRGVRVEVLANRLQQDGTVTQVLVEPHKTHEGLFAVSDRYDSIDGMLADRYYPGEEEWDRALAVTQ